MKRLFISLLLIIFGYIQSQLAYGDYFEVTPILYFFKYKEIDQTDRLINKEDGVLPGLKIGFKHENKNYTLEPHMSIYQGKIDYRGRTQSGLINETETREKLYNIGFRLTPQVSTNRPIQLFFGLRHWHWNRDILTRNSVLGLREEYTWQELSLGLKFESQKTHRSNYWLVASVLRIFNPEIKVHLPSSKLKLNLGEKPGFRISTGKAWEFIENTRISLGLNVEYWQFGHSDAVFTNDFFGNAAFLTEPDSESLHSALTVSFNHVF